MHFVLWVGVSLDSEQLGSNRQGSRASDEVVPHTKVEREAEIPLVCLPEPRAAAGGYPHQEQGCLFLITLPSG